MSFASYIDADRERAFVVLAGTVTGASILAVLRLLLDDPAWQPGFSRVWDLRYVTDLQLTREEEALIAVALQQERLRASRIAVVAQRRPVVHAVAAFQPRVTAWPVEVFRSKKRALAWLDTGEATGAREEGRSPEGAGIWHGLGTNAVITRPLQVVPEADVGGQLVLLTGGGEGVLRSLAQGKTRYLCGGCGGVLARRVRALQPSPLLLRCWCCGAVNQAPGDAGGW